MAVLNRHRDPLPPKAIYIGRGTPWGNPWIVGIHGTREEVLQRFKAYALEKHERNPAWLEPLRGRDLICSCAPAACHGHVLEEILRA